MHREDDLIFFDKADERDYPALSERPFMPIEGIPGLFQDILKAQRANMIEIQKLNSGISDRSYAEYMAAVQPYHVKSIRMQRVASGLFKYAAPEIIDAMLPIAL